MRRDRSARATQPELPADDMPSAEVLDELLRAFSADGADERTLAEVDLASPEVAELLAPTSPTPEPDGAHSSRPEPDDEVEGSDDVHVEVEVEAEAELDDAGAATGDAAHTGEDPGVDDAGDPPAADDGPPDVVGAPDDAAADDAGTGEPPPPAPSSATTRTIVIDASDDPPDAVYLAAGDPLLAASAGARGLQSAVPDVAAPASGAPVFIDDAAVESGETITLADASSATRIEPRLRERRIAVKRAAGRKRLWWVFVVVAVLVLVIAVLAVLGSSLFAIEDVRVDGAVNTDPARLQAVVDELEGTPVLRADTDRAERDLEAIPWVAAARVTTQFPHGATIELRERAPVATFQGGDARFRVIDIDGRVLDVLDAQPIEYLPITSDSVPDLEAGQFASQGFIAAANLVQSLTPELRALATSVAVTPNGSDLRMELTDGRQVRFGPGRELVVKLVRLQTKLDELAGGGFQYIDVSTDDVTTG
jgi:cell division protein FtsQ